MPTVPTYNDPQVREEALPSVRLGSDAPLEAFGGGASENQVIESANKLSSTAAEIYDRHQALADQQFAANANEAFRNVKQNLLYNNQDGLQMQRGQNAFSAPEVYGQRYQDDTTDLMNSANNDRQRAVLSSLKARYGSELNAEVQKHVYSESQTFDKESTDANITGAQNDAVDNYHQPGKVSQAVSDISHNVEMFGARQGWSLEQVQVQKTAALSKMHSDVIERMVNNGEDLIAQNYLDLHRDQMSAKDLPGTEKILETGMTRGESQRISDAIMSQTSDEATAMARVKEITDPKVRDATADRVKDQFALQQAEKKQRDEALTQKAAGIINNGGSFNDIPTGDLAKMSPQAQESLMSFSRIKARGIEPVTNYTKLYDLKTMASSEDTRDKFMNTDLMTVRNQMSDSDFKDLVNLQAGMRKSDTQSQQHLDGFLSKKQIADDALVQAGFTIKDKSSANQKNITQFYRTMDQELSEYQSRTGKKASNQEMQGIADSLLTKVVTNPGYLWDTSKPVFQMNPGDNFIVKPTQIPPRDQAQIDAALKARGITPTNDMRSQLYAQKLKGMIPNGQ